MPSTGAGCVGGIGISGIGVRGGGNGGGAKGLGAGCTAGGAFKSMGKAFSAAIGVGAGAGFEATASITALLAAS